MPMRYFVREHTRRGVFKQLSVNGFAVDQITISRRVEPKGTRNLYSIPTPFVTREVYALSTVARLLDISLFRHAIHPLKQWIHNDGAWRLQPRLVQNTAFFHATNSVDFLDFFVPRVQIAQQRRPVYKFIHLGIPHSPWVVDADCNFVGPQPGLQKQIDQSLCAARKVGDLLDRLRELGIYEGSLILITSDHGGNSPPRGFATDQATEHLGRVAGTSLALLMIKVPGSTGPVQLSGAPSHMTDIPATIFEELELEHDYPGRSALQLDPQKPRTRTYAFYDWRRPVNTWRSEYLDEINLYTVDGNVRDHESWRHIDRIIAPGNDTAR